MRKVVNAFAVLGLMLAALFVAVPTASAADSSTTNYPPPPSNCAQLNIGATSVHPGDSVLISGSNFHAGDALTVTLSPLGTTVGHVTVSSAGTFSTHFTMPLNATGSQLVVLVGSSVTICPVDPIQVLGAGVSGSSTGPGGTALTGTRIALYVAAALVLLVGGTALVMAGRRRRSRHAA